MGINAKLGIVVLNYNSSKALELTLHSLGKAKCALDFRVAVLDNASTDTTKAQTACCAFSKQFPKRFDTFIANSVNLGFSGGNNVLINHFLQDKTITHIVLLNSDVIVTDNVFDRLIATGADAVGPVTNCAGNTQTVFADYETSFSSSDFELANTFAANRFKIFGDYVCQSDFLGGFMMVFSRKLIETVGLLDERFYPGSYEDDDYCLRILEAGFTMHIHRGVYMHHYGSQSFSSLDITKRVAIGDENRTRFENKWSVTWQERTNEPLESCKIDMQFLLKKFDVPQTPQELLIGSINNAKELIKTQREIITSLQTQSTNANSHSTLPDSACHIGQEKTDPSKIINIEAPMLPLGILVKQLGFKIKKFFKSILGIRTTPEDIVHHSNKFWGSAPELQTSIVFIQLFFKLPFKMLERYYKNYKKNSLKDHIKQANKLAKFANTAINQAQKSKGRTILFLAPYPSKIFLKDGYFKRIKAVDNIFAKDAVRIYLIESDDAIAIPQFRQMEPDCFQITYTPLYTEHLDFVKSIAAKCQFVYCHSVLRIHQPLLEQIHLPKIIDIHGAVPEESHLYNNIPEYFLYSQGELYAAEHFNKFVCVTNAMQKHLTQKYGISNEACILMPTFDTLSVPKANTLPSPEYIDKQPYIIYSGGSQKWQKVNLMLGAIKSQPAFHYHILTPNVNVFKQECELASISNITIKSVDPENMLIEYQKAHYGFILRDDIVVNNVACPTKLIEYCSFGVIPIMLTSKLGDFAANGMQYVSLDDFCAGKLPSEDTRRAMAENNLAVIKNMALDYSKGEALILATAAEFINQRPAPPTPAQRPAAVGLVVTSFDSGGLEQVVFNLYEGYSKRGIPCYVFCETMEQGFFALKLHSEHHFVPFHSDKNLFRYFCKEKNITCLHYHFNTTLMDEMNAAGIKTLYTIHNIYTFFTQADLQKRAQLINTANHVVAVSQLCNQYYCKKTQTAKENVLVIPNGIDSKRFSSTKLDQKLTRKAFGFSDKDVVLAFVASFHMVKHQLNMVGAMELLVRKNPSIKLLFVGNEGHPKYYKTVKAAWQTSPAKENITFVPFFSPDQMGEFLRKTVDIFILPTLQEGCSNAVLEALFCEKPMLITNVGNAEDLKQYKSVVIVPTAYKDILDFTNDDIPEYSMKKECRNTNIIAEKLIWMADNLDLLNEKAKETKQHYGNKVDTSVMADSYIKLIK